MEIKLVEKVERLEAQLPHWEKWMYACHSAALVMLAHALIKAGENTKLIDLLFALDAKAAIPTNIPGLFAIVHQNTNIALISPARYWLWLVVELSALIPAAILILNSTWRKVPLYKRLDLIFGFILASWVTLLSLGAQDPLNMGYCYNILIVGFLLTLGLGYWWLHHKRDRAEEVFP